MGRCTLLPVASCAYVRVRVRACMCVCACVSMNYTWPKKMNKFRNQKMKEHPDMVEGTGESLRGIRHILSAPSHHRFIKKTVEKGEGI